MSNEGPARILYDEAGNRVGVSTNPIQVTGFTNPSNFGITGPVRVDSVGITGPIGPVGITGPVVHTGPFSVTGSVRVDSVGITGPIGPVGITGFVQVTGPMGVTGQVAVVGAVGVTGPVRVDSVGITGPVFQPTAQQLQAQVQGLGVPGSATGGVLSVQGVTGALAIPVYITDGVDAPAAVTRANAGATGSDRALVVVLSPNQQAIPVTSNPATSTPAIAVGTVVTTVVTRTAVRATTYNEPAANAQRSFSSSSASDTSAGTGARQIDVTYYDSTGAGPSVETITLNGTSAVNSVSTTMCFIEKIVVTTVGSGGLNAGIITMFNSTAGGGGTLATVAVGDNRTFWAHHYVATGKTCYITGLSGNNTNSSNGSVLTIWAKDLSATNQPEVQISDFVRVGGGTSQPVRDYNQLIKVIGPARILCYEACEGTPNITTRAAFDFYDQ